MDDAVLRTCRDVLSWRLAQWEDKKARSSLLNAGSRSPTLDASTVAKSRPDGEEREAARQLIRYYRRTTSAIPGQAGTTP